MHRSEDTNNCIYSCSFCPNKISPSTGYISHQGQLSCIHCISSQSGFESSINDLLQNIPALLKNEQNFIQTSRTQISGIRKRVYEFQQKIVSEISQFKRRMGDMCECLEIRLSSFEERHIKEKHQIEQLWRRDEQQPIKLLSHLKKPEFKVDKLKFQITKQLNHILIKAHSLDSVTLNLPDIKKEETLYKKVTISDTIVSCLKVIGDKIVAGTVAGEICVNNKYQPTQGYKIKGSEGGIKALDQYKGMLVSIASDISLWKFGENTLQIVKKFGVLQKNSYRLVLVLEKLGMILTSTGGADDLTIKLWSADNSVVINRLQGHTGPLKGLLKGKQNQVISYASDSTIRVWSAGERKLLRTIYHQERIALLDYCPQLNMIVLFDFDCWVTFYSYSFTGKAVISNRWKLSRLTTTMGVDRTLRVVTSKLERIRIFNLYGQKQAEIDIEKNELKSMELEFDRVWGGTGRGELICAEFVHTKNLLI